MKTELLKITKSVVLSAMEDTQFVLQMPENCTDPIEVRVEFTKEGVTAEIISLFRVKKGNKVNLTTVAHHKVPHTSCMTKIKKVLEDGAESDYIGKIIIEKPAQQTSSFLEDATLVLGDHTKNRSDPILEIEADDVKASHGATTGRVDKDQVYYLMSRGLTSQEAQNIIVEGFFESLIAQIADQPTRSQIYV